VSENVNSESMWVEWAKNAFKSIYGFDWQGDNVLLSRENLLCAFIDYYIDKFNNFPTIECLLEIAEIISWNIWQMDGLKFVNQLIKPRFFFLARNIKKWNVKDVKQIIHISIAEFIVILWIGLQTERLSLSA